MRLEMPLVKKQHYVPQFYLRRFADLDRKIHVYDKFSKQTSHTHIRQVANDAYFYDLSLETISELSGRIPNEQGRENTDTQLIEQLLSQVKDVQTVEKYLGRFESRFGTAIKKVLEGLESRKTFDQQYRSEIALMAAVQLWRTAARRESMRKKVVNFRLSPDAELGAIGHKLMMLNQDALERSAQVLQNHIWIIGMNDTNNPFYTSDNPVATYPVCTGIAMPGVKVILPLTPKCVLIMHERNYYRMIEDQDGQTDRLKPEDINFYNSLQVCSSHRQIYSIENNFDWLPKRS
jgi:hypothetical protein